MAFICDSVGLCAIDPDVRHVFAGHMCSAISSCRRGVGGATSFACAERSGPNQDFRWRYSPSLAGKGRRRDLV